MESAIGGGDIILKLVSISSTLSPHSQSSGRVMVDKRQTAPVRRQPLSPRGEKARARLKQAALVVLEQEGYHKMRIADVTGEAGVAAGLFYHYFDDLKSMTVEVLEDFVSRSLNVEAIEKGVPRGDWFERMLAHNRVIAMAYAERPGLTRCLLQLADEDPEFSRLLRRNFIHQLSWLVKQMPRLFPQAELSEHQALMVVYTLAGMGEAVLRDYYVNREPELMTEPLALDDIAELLTVMFYRGLFLENPPPEKLRYTKNLVYMVKSG
jgi:AcrR family transcriptional regulator